MTRHCTFATFERPLHSAPHQPALALAQAQAVSAPFPRQPRQWHFIGPIKRRQARYREVFPINEKRHSRIRIFQASAGNQAQLGRRCGLINPLRERPQP
jgi:hypothetical protein